MNKTFLKIEWSCSDGRNHTEVWEGKDDGKLYRIFSLITQLIHSLERFGKREEQ
jgi:hypothetical protein